MKKSEKIFVVVSILLIVVAIGIVLYNYASMTALFVYCGAVCLTAALIFFVSLFTKKEDVNSFKENLEKIVRTYDAVLVATSNLPSLDGRDVIKTMTVEALIDAQLGVRKPIYYKEYDESCGFVLLDEKEAIVYIMKANSSVVCPLELVVQEAIANKGKKDLDHQLLDDIDKTTVIKLENDKSYKVSPVREEGKNVVETETKEEPKEVEEDILPKVSGE